MFKTNLARLLLINNLGNSKRFTFCPNFVGYYHDETQRIDQAA